jgi:hypothetical protein
MSLNPNGSEDHKIKIKGLSSIQVGNYTQEQLDYISGLGSLSLKDIEKIQAAQAVINSLPPPSTSPPSTSLPLTSPPSTSPPSTLVETLIQGLDEGLDDEDREELQTLGRMVTRGRQINRYFTADEDSEVEGPNDTTSNSENDIDSDQRFDSSSDEAFDTERDGDQEDEDENM